MSASVKLGLRGLIKSMTSKVEEEFKAESTLDIIAETKPASTKPTNPIGNTSVTNKGKTLLGKP